MTDLKIPDFDLAFDRVIKMEGHFDDDPDDSGGLTIWGIAENRHPGWIGFPLAKKILETAGPAALRTDELLMQMAMDFYHEEFWSRLKLNELRSHLIAGKLFSMSVNLGDDDAAYAAQRSVNAQSIEENPPLHVDGGFGTFTRAAINTVLIATPRAKICLWNGIVGYQVDGYRKLANRKPKRRKYLRGWINRAYMFRPEEPKRVVPQT